MAEAAFVLQRRDEEEDLNEDESVIKTWRAIKGDKDHITLKDLVKYMEDFFKLDKIESKAIATLAFKDVDLDTGDNMDFDQFRVALGFE